MANKAYRRVRFLWRAFAAGICVAQSLAAGQPASNDSSRHASPVMLDLQGRKLADGKFVQWVENGKLHVAIDFAFRDGRHTEEKSSLQQTPRLVQDQWSWSEFENNRLLRHFDVNFNSGKAVAEKIVNGQTKQWSENIKIEPGRTFAGYAFVLALMREHEHLVNGEKIKLQAVGFTPKPRLVSVELSYGGLDQMNMAGPIVRGGRFNIHPEVPALAKLFVDPKDTHIWLTTPPAVGFLRWEGPLVEADDPVIRVDLLPGEHSGAAEPTPRP